MSDDTTTPETGTESATPSEQHPETPKPTETVDFWKQKAREQETRAKSNADAARRLQEIEDAQKSEQQRQVEATSRLERERDEARSETLRYRLAAEHKVPAEYVDLLGTGDEDTIASRAQRIGALVSAGQTPAQPEDKGKPGQQPVANLRPGASPEPQPTDDDDILRSLGYGADV